MYLLATCNIWTVLFTLCIFLCAMHVPVIFAFLSWKLHTCFTLSCLPCNKRLLLRFWILVCQIYNILSEIQSFFFSHHLKEKSNINIKRVQPPIFHHPHFCHISDLIVNPAQNEWCVRLFSARHNEEYILPTYSIFISFLLYKFRERTKG